MTSTLDIFGTTIKALNVGIQVRHVAEFDLQTCAPSDRVEEVFGRPAVAAFDQVPVRCGESSKVIGVIERTNEVASGSVVQDHMRRLDDSILIGADSPLNSFVRMAKQYHYRLVLTDNGVTGIVTGSDLLKLPARLLFFAFVTHLESTMAAVIRHLFPGDLDEWMNYLSPGRRGGVREKQSALKRRRLDPSLIELTELCDKREILRKSLGLNSKFTNDLDSIEKLRNSLAHSGTFVTASRADVAQLVAQVEAAEHWIDRLAGEMAKEEPHAS